MSCLLSPRSHQSTSIVNPKHPHPLTFHLLLLHWLLDWVLFLYILKMPPDPKPSTKFYQQGHDWYLLSPFQSFSLFPVLLLAAAAIFEFRVLLLFDFEVYCFMQDDTHLFSVDVFL